MSPYAVFSVLSWLFYLTILILRHRHHLVLAHLGKIASVLTGTAMNGGNDSIWFLPCLMVVGILFLFITRLRRPWLSLSAVVALSAAGYLLGLHRILLPFKVDVAFLGLSFYALGYLIKGKGFLDRLAGLRPSVLAAILAGAELLQIGTAFLNIEVSGISKVAMISNTVGDYFLFHLSALGGIAAFTIAAFLLKRVKGLNLLGINSLLILVLHKPILYLLKLATRSFIDPGFWVYGILASAVTAAVILPLIGPVNRRLGWMVGTHYFINECGR